MISSKKLEGKIALVTGASKGIGAAIAKEMAAAGASVIVNYASSKAGAERIVTEITDEGGQAVAIQADLSKKDDIKRLFAQAIKAFGKIDILVNNAGIYEFVPLEEICEDHLQRLYALNVFGLLWATQEAVKQFGPGGGCIINISSVASTSSLADISVYSSTKAAVDAITRCLAKELGPRHIRVNAINPGLIDTEGVHAAGLDDLDFQKQIEVETPLGRIGQTQDVAPVAVFLASSDARWITGETIIVSGGHH